MWAHGYHCSSTQKTTLRHVPYIQCLHHVMYIPSNHTFQPKDRHSKHPRRRLTHPAASFQTNNDFATPDITQEEAPKFRPFIAQDEILNRVKSFKYTKSTPYGQVVVVPLLSDQFIDPAANILTESFADAMGASPYRNYLRKQIKKYLHHHIIRLAPKAVVLAALLVEEEGGITYDDNVDGGNGNNNNNEDSTAVPLENNKQINGGEDTQVEHNSNDHTNRTSTTINNNNKEPSPSSLQNAKVLGVVELSFSETTRSKYLTLNSPTDRSYLCNMAILSEQRKKGFGKILLDAAEQLAAVLGEREVWLHLRLKDDKTAGRLYRGAGYKVVKEDPFLLVLLNMDRRYLMRKRIKI